MVVVAVAYASVTNLNLVGFDDHKNRCGVSTMMSAPTRALVLLLLLLLVIAAATAKEAQECVLGDDGECTDDCTDWHEQCNEWARAGECTDNPGYMIDQCRRACRTCDMSQEERDALTEERLKVIDGRDEEKARCVRMILYLIAESVVSLLWTQHVN